MNTGEILTLIAVIVTSIAVIVALCFGVVSIRHASNLQKKAFKQSLLNEIIQWARAVSAQTEERQRGMNLPSWFNNWAILRSERIGITDIAFSIDPDFKSVVNEGIECFDKLDILVRGDSSVPATEIANEQRTRCTTCIEKCKSIIEEAQKYKIKNIH